jgi:hypothetical protein
MDDAQWIVLIDFEKNSFSLAIHRGDLIGNLKPSQNRILYITVEIESREIKTRRPELRSRNV